MSTASEEPPRFAVVGRVNKGKSSVIATLAEDDRVAISPLPGTTRRASEFPVRVDGEAVFVLVDTPGFEEAAAALAWMKRTRPPAAARPQRVRDFVEAHRGGEDFEEERTLLAPILGGAGILYVVDGTKPYRENYKAEMEILRWTGQPSMALINRIGQGDHAEEWRTALNQYFRVVRDFDAHSATFEERVRLLTTFRELHDPWRASVQRAIDALRAERGRRRGEVVDTIATLLAEALSFTLEASEGEQREVGRLVDEFHQHLRELEAGARRRVEALYNHDRVRWEHADALSKPVFGEDLFAEETWSLLGLAPTQVFALYTISGALTGGVIDAGVGAASFGTGAVIGGLIGAGAGVTHLQRRFARATSAGGLLGRMRRALSDERRWRVGPFTHPNFPFVLLDRALLHFDAVRTRAHARNATESGVATLGATALAKALTGQERRRLHAVFRTLSKHPDGPPSALREKLRTAVEGRVAALE